MSQTLATHQGEDQKMLRRQLRQRLAEFEAPGGLGVDLADEIDSLKIALAARTASREQEPER